MNPVTGTGCISVDIGGDANLKLVDKFCYLGDMLSVDGDADKAHGLNREDAMDCSRWRKQIWMIDDQDKCEWVNVSSGTGSPRLSRTKSRAVKRLYVYVMCVFLVTECCEMV